MEFKNIHEIYEYYKVKSSRETNDGLIAIRSGGYWHYFRYEKVHSKSHDWVYRETGTTLKFEK